MCTDNFHFHAKNYHYFHPLTTVSLWFTDQMSTQSTRKQVIKITTFEKVKCPLLVKYGKSSVASSHTCPPAPTSRWPLKPPSWQPTFKRGYLGLRPKPSDPLSSPLLLCLLSVFPHVSQWWWWIDVIIPLDRQPHALERWWWRVLLDSPPTLTDKSSCRCPCWHCRLWEVLIEASSHLTKAVVDVLVGIADFEWFSLKQALTWQKQL